MNLSQALARVRELNRTTAAKWTSEQERNYAEALVEGSVSMEQLATIGTDLATQRQRNRARVEMLASNLGLPGEYVTSFVDSFLEYGDVELALTEVRRSDLYERYFPGNKRDDGSVRYSEREYQMVVESYAATLEDYGLNPDVYAERFGDLVAGDVAPDEFVGRIEALHERVIRAPEEVRQATAAEFGLATASDAALLGIALDPEIGEQVRERRLSIAQVTGQAKRFGFTRSRQRVEALLNAGLSADQASAFYSGASPTLTRLGGSAAATGELFGITDLEDAAIAGSPDALSTAARLSRQEASRWSQQGSVMRDQTGALTGLSDR